MFNLGQIGAAVTLDDSEFVKTLGGLEKKTSTVLKKVGSIALAYFGLNSLQKFAEDSVRAYIRQENAVDGLNRALRKLGQGSYSKQLQDVASSLQKITTNGDEATLEVMTLGLNMGIAADKMETATKAAMGLAAKYSQKLDMRTAMELIAKAANGNTARLKMFGIQIDESKSKMEKFNELLKQGEDAFPLATAKTFGQHLIQLQNAWADLQEQVGNFIVMLFDLGDTQKGVLNMINEATDWLKENVETLVFEIKYVYSYFEAGVKSAYAIFEPIILYVWRSVKDLVNNVVALGQWAFDNADKIWDALPDLFWAHLKDIYEAWKKTFDMILNLAVNFGKAVWQAIRHGSLDGFNQLWDELQKDFMETMSASMENKVKVLMDAGVTEIPEMQKTAFISDVVDMYKQLPNRLDGVYREMGQKQAGYVDEYYKRLEEKRKKAKDEDAEITANPAEATKNNVAGSFSAAVLAGLFGVGSPEKETAKNTKRMVALQEETNRELKKKKTEKYTS